MSPILVFFSAFVFLFCLMLWWAYRVPSSIDELAHARSLDQLQDSIAVDTENQRISEQDAKESRQRMDLYLASSLQQHNNRILRTNGDVINRSRQKYFSQTGMASFVNISVIMTLLAASASAYWFFYGTPGLGDMPFKERLDPVTGDLIFADLLDERTHAMAQLAAIKLGTDPEDFDANFALAQINLSVNRIREAIPFLQKSQQIEPDNQEVANLIGKVKALTVQMQMSTSAKREGSKKVGPGPEQIDLAMELSEEQRSGMILSMVEGLSSRLETDPDDLEGWHRLARAHEVLENEVGYIKALRQIVRLDESDIEAAKQLARTLINRALPARKLDDEVKTIFERIYEKNPQDLEALFFVGVNSYQDGNLEKAELLWSKALELIPADHPQHEQMKKEINRLLSDASEHNRLEER